MTQTMVYTEDTVGQVCCGC